jgi:hypothetical protein
MFFTFPLAVVVHVAPAGALHSIDSRVCVSNVKSARKQEQHKHISGMKL